MTGRPLLGAEVLAGYLMFGTVTGIMMALFLDNGKQKSFGMKTVDHALMARIFH